MKCTALFMPPNSPLVTSADIPATRGVASPGGHRGRDRRHGLRPGLALDDPPKAACADNARPAGAGTWLTGPSV